MPVGLVVMGLKAQQFRRGDIRWQIVDEERGCRSKPMLVACDLENTRFWFRCASDVAVGRAVEESKKLEITEQSFDMQAVGIAQQVEGESPAQSPH